MNLWKGKVKPVVLKVEKEEWRKGLVSKAKGVLYAQIKETPGFEPYLHLAEYVQVGKLRFNLRSGMCYLNIEIGRRSRKVEDRLCTLCDLNVDESVGHFVFHCPAYGENRSVFELRLATFCEKWNTPSLLRMWRSGVLMEQAIVVLGDPTQAVQGNAIGRPSPGK